MNLIKKPTDKQINKVAELFTLMTQGKLTEDEYIQAIKYNAKNNDKD